MAGTILHRSPVPAHHALYVPKGRDFRESPAPSGTACLAADGLGHGCDAGPQSHAAEQPDCHHQRIYGHAQPHPLIHLYKKFHPRLPEWFIEKVKEFLLYYIEPPREWPSPIWEEPVEAQMVYTDAAQYAVAESLKEYAHHWKYDPLHKR